MHIPSLWVMRHSEGTVITRWDVGYYLSIPDVRRGNRDLGETEVIVVYKPVFYPVYTQLSRGVAADKCHYLNGGEKY